MIVLDSGLGGLSVVRALRAAQPGMAVTYVADTAGFPYGARSMADISARAQRLVRALVMQQPNTPIVIACNTLSTLCLTALRATFSIPFVGTVPAIKTAAEQSRSRRFTLLATPNTVASEYSQGLIDQFARDCVVDRYGAPQLAAMSEAILLGATVDDAALRAELAPAFVDDARGKTDCMVLGCTHYPLIADALTRVSPWPVIFVDSSEAIARRALSLHAPAMAESIAYVTAPPDIARYRPVFAREGFASTDTLSVS